MKLWHWLKAMGASQFIGAPCQECGKGATVWLLETVQKDSGPDSTTFRVKRVRRLFIPCAQRLSDEES